MSHPTDRPSQAEGEDPDLPATGTEPSASGKPSQAEGEDAVLPRPERSDDSAVGQG